MVGKQKHYHQYSYFRIKGDDDDDDSFFNILIFRKTNYLFNRNVIHVVQNCFK